MARQQQNDGSSLDRRAGDEVLVDLGKEFPVAAAFHLVPSDKEVVYPAQAAGRVYGKVVDDATGQPIEKFKVVTGMKWSNDNQRCIGTIATLRAAPTANTR